ncbi:hypothetical protein [Nocardia arthritidis]|uniref:Uncharacterized protein n=1 Tax=Nocardia arthritidis TaxID=228602 RepID=A0A6G9YML6_9NOCA|nr:hypothetical protein [Nocardia arthritidis]QIS14529.1 hypothetical protein F5544_33465 [Nocardia arthritidis]
MAAPHESQLVRTDRDGWRIASPALESEIHDGIEPATSMRLHLLSADALHRRRRPERGGDPGAVAAGGDDHRAASTYITAAEERLRCVSDAAAPLYAETGLALPVRRRTRPRSSRCGRRRIGGPQPARICLPHWMKPRWVCTARDCSSPTWRSSKLVRVQPHSASSWWSSRSPRRR